jgi:hypothetical protein
VKPPTQKNPFLGYLSLFTSVGTLLCCALPSLLVLLGLGATVGAVLSSAPWLVTLSRHKQWVFLVSGFLIAGNFLYVYKLAPKFRAEGEVCLPHAPEACSTASRFSRIILWVSASIYAVGLFAAYLLGPILMGFDS